MLARIVLTAILMAAAMVPEPATAQSNYPTRPITLIVPFPAGGPTDIIARIVAQSLSQSLGQSVVVDNRAGGGGNPGIALVARATPDGYTLLLTSTAIAVNPALYASLPYDPLKDFVPISELVNAPNVLFVKPIPASPRSPTSSPKPRPSRTSTTTLRRASALNRT
jgi:tripartite-type tricarboxylate transporter receptor subunit TctC